VLLAGHLDTVPIADNVPSRREGDLLSAAAPAT
jgi:succinyl-diaminopimelate desuccinylase